jgi:rubrerythrin
MKQITQQNLINAFGGESQAHMRYLHFAVTAQREGYPNMARLWRAIAHAEYVHAGDHYRELKHLDGGFTANSMAVFGPGDTVKNLNLSIAGESFEIEEMYPVYIETAKVQNDIGAKKSFEWAFATEKLHKQMFEQALSVIEHGSDVALGPVQICEVCGYTLEGQAPDVCPLCKARKDKFTEFA